MMSDMNADRLAELEATLQTGALNHRQAALKELANAPSELAVPAFARLSTAPDFLCRRFAATGLGNHITPASLDVLKARMGQETDNNVLAEIANALFEFGEPAIPLLQAMFEEHDNWLIRQTIISVVMESDADQVLLGLIERALVDNVWAVRETAILALGRTLRGPLQPEAMTLLSDLSESKVWRDRWRAATALRLASDPRAKVLLAKLQQDENHYVAAAALESSLPS